MNNETSNLQPVNRHDWIPLSLWIAGIALISAMGMFLERDERQSLIVETKVTAEQVQLRLESCINSRATLVSSLASLNWQDATSISRDWVNKVEPLYNLYPGIQALNFVDPKWIIKITYPSQGNAAALNKDLHFHPNANVPASLLIAKQENRAVRTNIVDLLQSGPGFVIYRQITSVDGRLLGFANGVFRLEKLLQTCLFEENIYNRFQYALYEDDGSLVFLQGKDLVDRNWLDEIKLQIQVVDRNWLLKFAMTPAYRSSLHSYLHYVVIFFGLLLVSLSALLLRAFLVRQKSLQESQRKYQHLVESQSNYVLQMTLEGAFEYVSPSFCKFLGKNAKELIGTDISLYIHEEDREAVGKMARSLLNPPHIGYMELRAKTPKGWRWLALSNTSTLNKKGRVDFVTSVAKDITDLKQLEEQVARTKRMETMGKMAGAITHDFNNLLHIMLGNLEYVIQEAGDDVEYAQDLKHIEESIARAMTLTKKLGSLSRQEDFHPGIVELNSFVLKLEKTIRYTLPEHIALTINQSDKNIYALADIDLLEQVLLNLYFNAKDALINNGSLSISLRQEYLDPQYLQLHHDLKNKIYACIKVIDNGLGINAEVLPKIFDPYFTTKPKGQGSGFGLANCYNIIRQHHGLILADSTPDSGTVFSIYLPTTEGQVELDIEQPLAEQKKTSLKGKTLLIADDESEILRLFTKVLEHEGAIVLQATNGQEALALVQRGVELKVNSIDIAILDLVMPIMGGREASIKIKALMPDLPIIYATGFDPEKLSEDKPPFDSVVLRKPFTPGVLIDEITKLLKG